jgi:hypothetical protein
MSTNTLLYYGGRRTTPCKMLQMLADVGPVTLPSLREHFRVSATPGKRLRASGFIEPTGGPGSAYQITDAGRQALADTPPDGAPPRKKRDDDERGTFTHTLKAPGEWKAPKNRPGPNSVFDTGAAVRAGHTMPARPARKRRRDAKQAPVLMSGKAHAQPLAPERVRFALFDDGSFLIAAEQQRTELTPAQFTALMQFLVSVREPIKEMLA